jgi:hypothetical protein
MARDETAIRTLIDRVFQETGMSLPADEWWVTWEMGPSSSGGAEAQELARFFSPIGKKFSCEADVIDFVKLNLVKDGDENRDDVRGRGGDGVGDGDDVGGHAGDGDGDGDGDEDMDIAPTQVQPDDGYDDDDYGNDDGEEADEEDEYPANGGDDDGGVFDNDHENIANSSSALALLPESDDEEPATATAIPPSPGDGLMAIERERAANIARNKEKMAALKIGRGAANPPAGRPGPGTFERTIPSPPLLLQPPVLRAQAPIIVDYCAG